ncbi:hypothetical protein AB0K12_27860 [Nonomuraea sp. NPDC049419]|uniref:hypothetical protein n=1 Tax=Nonomuraea sp. NPDC049419 TaxID=3155772 RepID=UPI003428FAF5
MPNEEFLAPSGLPEPFPSVADDVMARAAGAVTDAALRDVTSPIRDAHGELEDARRPHDGAPRRLRRAAAPLPHPPGAWRRLHRIAVLERFRPIAFGGAPNLVDCAVAWCWPERVRRELTYVWGGGQAFFRISSAPPRRWPTRSGWSWTRSTSTSTPDAAVRGFPVTVEISGTFRAQ